MNMKKQLLKISCICAVLLLLLCVPWLHYRDAVAHRPPTLGVPLWDWIYSPITYACITFVLFLLFVFARHRSYALVPKTKSLLLTAICSACFALLLNPNSFSDVWQMPFSILFFSAFFFIGMAVFHRFSFLIWIPFIFMAIVLYAVDYQCIVLSHDNLMQVFGTSWEDAKLYLTPTNIALIPAAILLSALMYYPVYKILRNESHMGMGFTGTLLFLILLAGLKPIQHHLQVGERYVWPLGKLEVISFNTVWAARDFNRLNAFFSVLPSQISVAEGSVTPHKSSIICLLHIGESTRADHLGIYGYRRNTTPWLNTLNRLVYFPVCISAASTTDRAVLVMLTNARRDFLTCKDKKMLPSSGSLMDFFSTSGFKSAAFWNAGEYYGNGVFEGEARFFSRTASNIYLTKTNLYHDQIADVLQFVDQENGENIFITINNRGSHAFFDSFDHTDPAFTPVRELSPNDAPHNNPKVAQYYVNAYDNTIHYLDSYIQKLLESLQGKPYIYIYMSDHGEYVGEEGYWTRGNAPHSIYHKERACMVPFFIIASPEFEALHPHFKTVLENLRRNQHLVTGQEHLFHTMLGIFGIKTPFYDRTLDLSSSDPQPYSGPGPEKYYSKRP